MKKKKQKTTDQITARKITIGSAAFKARCLSLLAEVSSKHVSVIITKHGKVMAELRPVIDGKKSLFGCLKDTLFINGDIIGSTGEEWDAES